jgi:hypothetical protein
VVSAVVRIGFSDLRASNAQWYVTLKIGRLLFINTPPLEGGG